MRTRRSTSACTNSAKSSSKVQQSTNVPAEKKADFSKLDLLTTQQVAHYTTLSESTFEKRRSHKKSPAYIKIGGRVLYRREVIDQWLDAQTHEPRGGADA